MLKKVTCLILSILMLFVATVSSSAYTTDDVANAALAMIFKHEGVYTSIVCNDNGAVSLGKVGWHGFRALRLLRSIAEANPEQAEELLGEDFYNEIMTATDADWNYRVFTAAEKKLAEKLLATEESKKAQDALAFEDIKSYIIHGQSMGITDGKALVYFADIENQMGAYGAERVAKIAISSAGSASAVTLKDMYNAAMSDRTAASSPTRRKSAYDYCNALTFDSQGVTSSFRTGEYKITAEPTLRVRSGPGTSYSQVTTSGGSTLVIPTGTKVTVTEISGDWGKISYSGKTGWINLLYAEYISAPVTSSDKPDLNGNGKVDASDARLILRASAKLESLSASQKKLADVNSDGNVTASDARTVLRMAAKLQ